MEQPGSDIIGAEGRCANFDPAHSKAVMRCGIWEYWWDGEWKGSLAVKGGLGFVDPKIVYVEYVTEFVECSGDQRACLRCRDEADVIDDGGPNEGWKSVAVAAENVGKSADKKKRAQWVALCDAFK